MERATAIKGRGHSAAGDEAARHAQQLFDQSRKLLSQADAEVDPVKRSALVKRANELGDTAEGLARVADKFAGGGVQTAVRR